MMGVGTSFVMNGPPNSSSTRARMDRDYKTVARSRNGTHDPVNNSSSFRPGDGHVHLGPVAPCEALATWRAPWANPLPVALPTESNDGVDFRDGGPSAVGVSGMPHAGGGVGIPWSTRATWPVERT